MGFPYGTDAPAPKNKAIFNFDHGLYRQYNYDLDKLFEIRLKTIHNFIIFMVSVFISHSKHDVHLRKFFAEICNNVRLHAKYMEWQDLEGQYAGEKISRLIRAGVIDGLLRDYDTSAVFVLLGEKLQNPPTNTPEFTHNWVSFEVGAAASCLKPVWVFEEFNKFIKFPIPYVTDYAQFTLDDPKHLKYYGDVFTEQIKYPTQRKTITPLEITCPHEKCNAKYRYWSKSEMFHCPVCRQEVYFKKDNPVSS